MAGRVNDSLRLIWLEAFLAVAGAPSLTEAADVLDCDQSTASRYIVKLERWFDKRLFSTFSPPTLTEDGEEFSLIAIQIVSQLYNFREDPSDNLELELLKMQTEFLAELAELMKECAREFRFL
jgi:DNA-binding transcriptional LysR family regulator